MARTAIHPGEHLADELKALGMSAAALSRDINVPVNRITGIINGTRAITADTAIRLGHWFGTSAEFWLNLQKLYELRRAHADVGAAVERLPSLGAFLRERSTRPDEDAPPHVQPQIIAGSTKKMHATDYRARQPPRKLDRAEFTSEPSGQLERHDEHGRRCRSTRTGSTETAGGSATRARLPLRRVNERERNSAMFVID